MRSMLFTALSFIIAGVLFISLMHFSGNLSETATLNNIDLFAQTKLKTAVDVIKNDLRKVGYQIDPENYTGSNNEIIDFSHNSITFHTDIDTLMNHITRGTIELRHDNDRLIRNVNDGMVPSGSSDPSGSPVTDESVEISDLDSLHIVYYDKDGDIVAPDGSSPHGSTPEDSIRSFEVTAIVELPEIQYGEGEPYQPRAYWKSEVYPKNIGR